MESSETTAGAAPGHRAGSRWLWLAAIVAVLIQLLAVYWPGSSGSEQLVSEVGIDKVVHALIFGVPTYLLVWLTGRRLLVGTAFAVHAPISELVQWRFLPYRDGDIWDCVADLCGIAIALLVVSRVNRAGS